MNYYNSIHIDFLEIRYPNMMSAGNVSPAIISWSLLSCSFSEVKYALIRHLRSLPFATFPRGIKLLETAWKIYSLHALKRLKALQGPVILCRVGAKLLTPF